MLDQAGSGAHACSRQTAKHPDSGSIGRLNGHAAPFFSNRFEIKFLTETRRLEEIKAALSGLLDLDRNGNGNGGYCNYSIYFDSPDYRFYSEKHEGLLNRIKPRLRLYRPAADARSTAMFLELKERRDRITGKRRTPVDVETAEALLAPAPAVAPSATRQSSILAEFHYLTERFRLTPCVTVRYHRVPYDSGIYPGLRVTFDSLVQCSFATTLNNPDDAFLYALPANWLVIELKYNDKVPEFVLKRFNSLGLQQRTFSKYAVSLECCFDGIRALRSGRLNGAIRHTNTMA